MFVDLFYVLFRGEECPYRHETPTDPTDPLSSQKLRDRYFGKDDPVAKKLLSRYEELLESEPTIDILVHILQFSHFSLLSDCAIR